MVLRAWKGEPKDGDVVNHINGRKTDNVLSNLEYCSSSQNSKHAHKRGLVKQYVRAILQFSKGGIFRREWKSAALVEKTMGISAKCISGVALGEKTSAGGYIWKYKEPRGKPKALGPLPIPSILPPVRVATVIRKIVSLSSSPLVDVIP